MSWNDRLISAPLMARAYRSASDDGPPTFCLLAPRPEQLARLAVRLALDRLAAAQEVATPANADEIRPVIEFDAVVPERRPVLRFRPWYRRVANSCPIPEDLDLIRYTIRAQVGQNEIPLWEEHVPPILGWPWWDDRVLSLADLAGQTVRFKLGAGYRDGRTCPVLRVWFDRVALMSL
jgi:hypothetical protein